MEQPLGMEYTITLLEGRRLVLRYTVRNASSRSVLLTTPLVEVGDDGVLPVDEKLYVYLDPDGILHLTKRAWPVPDDVDVYFPEVPRLTALAPGAKHEEAIEVDLPVDVRYPYRDVGEVLGEPVTVEAYGVAFSIGYVVMEGQGWVPGGPEIELGYAELASSQRLLQGMAVPLRVAVREQTEG